MKLIFDTETTGLALFNRPIDDPKQPRLVSLAAILVDDKLEIVDQLYCIVKPHKFVIPAEVSNIHGITTEQAMKEGSNVNDVIGSFGYLLEQADELIGHNLKFDKHIMSVELVLSILGKGFEKKLNSLPSTCTMLTTTSICKLPGKRGLKWPKLEEAYTYCFGKTFKDAHNSKNDAMATLEVYKWLVEKGHLVSGTPRTGDFNVASHKVLPIDSSNSIPYTEPKCEFSKPQGVGITQDTAKALFSGFAQTLIEINKQNK